MWHKRTKGCNGVIYNGDGGTGTIGGSESIGMSVVVLKGAER